MSVGHQATIEDLYNVPDRGKAELVNGELVLIGPSGIRPGRAGGKILASLSLYEDTYGGGFPLGAKAAYIVDLPNRQSFCPDISWTTETILTMGFGTGPPVFAVEVRDEPDYGVEYELHIVAKTAEYFAAGTLVVWDVDLLGDDVVRKYTPNNLIQPEIFRRGAAADAEPAVPGWTFPVDKLFD